MPINFWKENRLKVINVLLIVLAIIFLFYSKYQLINICTSVQNCTSTERSGTWVPLITISVYLILLLTPFIFIPQHYFKAWLYRIASWTLPVAGLFILSENPSSGSVLSFGRDGLAKIMGVIIINITIVFLLHHYAKINNKLQKVSWYWYVILLFLMLYASTNILKFIL